MGVSVSTILRYIKLKASGSEIAAKPSPGRKTRILRNHTQESALWRQLEENDTATLEDNRQMFEKERGVRVSVATMSRAAGKLGWTFKKDQWHPPREEHRRGALGEYVKSIVAERFVFVDECSTNIALGPIYARAPKGKRAFEKAHRNWGKNISLV